MDYPNQLNCLHPGLTELGKSQVIALRKQVVFAPEDVILVSPTKRTIETALLLTPNKNFVFFSPLVGPRMFPRIQSLFLSSAIRSIPRKSSVISILT
ncbi:histidine phosphatase family protein [Paenibacillus amylolyticus]|nr:phosphoglycerate mutase family protein [Paenibacillus amylolyticus]MCL6659998.1 histidine phosphatase family protein [Paenibacillus amylolyticus]